ncbi:MAG: hypothetical protein ACQETB_12255, partial [Halobacteriota archaeon]
RSDTGLRRNQAHLTGTGVRIDDGLRIGLLYVAGLTAIAPLTLWGGVDWSNPWFAVCQSSVIFTAMCIGGSLGGVLPGSSTDRPPIGRDWES